MQALAQRMATMHTLNGDDSKFQRLLEVLPAAAYTCDSHGLITSYNQRAVEVWGRAPKLNDPADRFCGSFKLFAPDGSPIRHEHCWMALALQENYEYNGHEIVIEQPDGRRRTVLAHANPFRDDSGRLTGAVNVLVDITDRKHAEDALRLADRRKDEFLAMLAHELRNPLAPIRNALEIMRLDGDNPETQEQARDVMERQLHQMVRLVDDLMDISRITRNKMVLRKERVELAAAVQSAVEAARPLIEQGEHELHVTLPARPVHLDADLTRLAQVFSNLLTNAARYMERRGRIWLSAAVEGGQAVVRVRDAGVGIPAGLLDRIFEPFIQGDRSLERSQGGLGIGLSLVKGLVEMHGGTVQAHSDGPGKGSEFTVRLPILAGDAPAGADETEQAPAGSTILVVDDNEDTATGLAAVLRLLGHDTRTASDGQAAVQAAELFRPDVVFLDIGLPKLSGYAAARKIREHDWGRRMFLIAVTGWGQEEDRRRAIEAGFDLHVLKPVEAEVLEGLLACIRNRA